MRWLVQVEGSSEHGKYSEQSSCPCGNAKARPLGTCLLEVDPSSAFEHIGEVDIFPINEVKPLAVDTLAWRRCIQRLLSDLGRNIGFIESSHSKYLDYLNPR